MKSKFEIEYSPEFYKDLDAITHYIKNELKNNIAAINLINKVEKSILNRLENPLDFEQYKTKANNTYYRIYINNYTVFYTVSDNIMKVRRIVYSLRDFEKLL